MGDFSKREYATTEKAVEAGCVYVLGAWVNRFTWSGNNGRTLRVGQIHSSNGELIESVSEGKWKLHDFFIRGWGYSIDYQFEDPFGELRRLSLAYEKDESAEDQIRSLLNKVRELSSFMSWGEYDMSLKLKQLAQDNEELRTRVQRLEAELASLRSQDGAA